MRSAIAHKRAGERREESRTTTRDEVTRGYNLRETADVLRSGYDNSKRCAMRFSPIGPHAAISLSSRAQNIEF